MDALMVKQQEILKFSDEQPTTFTTDFEQRLAKYLRNVLHPELPLSFFTAILTFIIPVTST